MGMMHDPITAVPLSYLAFSNLGTCDFLRGYYSRVDQVVSRSRERDTALFYDCLYSRLCVIYAINTVHNRYPVLVRLYSRVLSKGRR